MEMCEGGNEGLVFTGIRFRSDLILVDCATEDMPNLLGIIDSKLPEWKGTKLLMCARDNLPGTYMATVPKP